MKNLSLVFRSLALPVLLLTLNAAGAQEKQPLRYVDAATLTVIGKSMCPLPNCSSGSTPPVTNSGSP